MSYDRSVAERQVEVMEKRSSLGRAAGLLTNDGVELRNCGWMVISRATGASALILAGGVVLQTYLVEAGLSKVQIGGYASVAAVAAGVSMFCLMGIIDRVRDVMRALSLAVYATAIFPLVLIALTLLDRQAATVALVFGVVIGAEVIRGPLQSTVSMLDANMLVRAFRHVTRGRQQGVGGFVASIVGMGVGLGSAGILKSMGYPWAFTACFFGCVVCILLSGLALTRVRLLPDLAVPGRSGSMSPLAALRDVWNVPLWRRLIAPNVLRGFTNASEAFIMVIGLEYLHLGREFAGYAAFANTLAALIGFTIISIFLERWGIGNTCIVAHTCACVGLVLLALTKSPILFVILFAMVMFGDNIEANVVPLGVYRYGPPECIGAFNGSRLAFMLICVAVFSPPVGYLLGLVGPKTVLLLAGGLNLVTGLMYSRAFRG